MRCLILFLLLSSNVNAQIITTVAGGGTSGLGDGGPATAATIGYFAGICFDSHGNLYIADGNHNRIRKVDVISGVISTFAGNGSAGFSGDNGMATNAELNGPTWVTADNFDNLYITDAVNNRIRKVLNVTGIITTIAGNGTTFYNGDNIMATNASLSAQGIATDLSGNLYIADPINYRVRKVNLGTGLIKTIAGTGDAGFSGDGTLATAAKINGPYGICTDNLDNLYIADRSNGRVRKVTSDGVINTIAGNGASTYIGDGMAATASQMDPIAITMDLDGNLHIADYENNRIRKVDLSGVVSTVAGNGIAGYSGDSGNPILAKIDHPEGVSFDYCGNMCIADFNNKRVRKITYHPVCNSTSLENTHREQTNLSVYPNPAQTDLTITAPKITSITITNLLAKEVFAKNYNNATRAEIDISYLPPGVYVVKANGFYVQKLIKE